MSVLLVGFMAVATILGCRAPDNASVNTDDSSDTDTDTDTDSDDDTADTDTEDGFDWDFDTDPEADGIGPGPLCPEGTTDLFNSTIAPFYGGEDSVDLAVYVFSYFQCPSCPAFAKKSYDAWNERPEYQSRVRLYYHHYPFGSNETSEGWLQHAASVAAGAQGMDHFWAIHDRIFNVEAEDPSPPDGVKDLIDYAENDLGLDMDLFQGDLYSNDVANFLAWEKSQLNALDISSTPSVFICGEKINWGLLEYTIDSYLE